MANTKLNVTNQGVGITPETQAALDAKANLSSISLRPTYVGYGSSLSGITGTSDLTYSNITGFRIGSQASKGTNYGFQFLPWSGAAQPIVFGTTNSANQGLWFAQSTPSSSNYSLMLSSGSLLVNNATEIELRINNGNVATINATSATVALPLRATSNFSATTYYSGSTLLSTVIASLAGGGASTTVSGGTNVSVTTVGSTATVNGTQVITRSGAYTVTYDYTDNLFNGGVPATWTLPALKANVKFTITHIGSGPLTLNSSAGGNDIYETTGAGAVNSININQNEGYMFICNGTYYVALKLTM